MPFEGGDLLSLSLSLPPPQFSILPPPFPQFSPPRDVANISFISKQKNKKIQGRDKSRAVIAVLARMLLAPWLLFASMLLVEEKCCWDEPEGYQAPGWKRWLARRAKKGTFSKRERR